MAPHGSTGTPERLERADGAWTLELERLVYSTPWFLRPQRLEVRGEQAILQQLREIRGCDALIRDAERLFGQNVQEQAYVVRGGRFCIEVQTGVRKARAGGKGSDVLAEADAGVASEQLEQLHKRIDGLEAGMRALQKMVQEVAKTAVQAAAAGRVRAGDDAGNDGGRVTGATGARDAMAATMNDPGPAAAPAAKAEPGPIAFPTLDAVCDLVRGIAGANANLIPRTTIDWSVANRPHCCVIKAKDGRSVGMIVLDFEASARLAGALLMEPDENIAAQVAAEALSEEMADSAGEVCNTLMSAFNTLSAIHLRTEKLQVFDASAAEQIVAARAREDYGYNRGGCLTFFAF